MTERHRFVEDAQHGMYSMSELCERHGVSRKTGYKWLERFAEEGRRGLTDRSRAPTHCPHKIEDAVAQTIREARRRHPTWGPRKLLQWIEPRYPELELPAASTVGDLLSREGLVNKRVRRTKHLHPGVVPAIADAPNDLWTADFKGHFRTGDGKYCYPLTIADLHSRMLLGCDALLSTRGIDAKPCMERLFREHGLPRAIRSDNGIPFASTALHGMTLLNVWWMKLGIMHQRILPASPQQNGAHERMHRTLKAEATRPAKRNRRQQQHAFDLFRQEYNHERPHESLHGRTPASLYRPAPRPYPERLPKVEYPGHYEVRFVCNAGTFRFKNRQLFIANALHQQHIGLEEIDDGLWAIYFCNVQLGRFHESEFIIRP
ncbi:MAG TPA: IS481 family transposase [Gemmatimonadaceae bacterium]